MDLAVCLCASDQQKEKGFLWEQLNPYQEFEDPKIIPLNWTPNAFNLRVNELQS